MLGNLYLDAIVTGVIGSVAGLLTKRVLKGKTRREFYATGGLTYQEAVDEAAKLEESDGWLPLGPPEQSTDKHGRDVCWECQKDHPSIETRGTPCPDCGESVYSYRDETEIWTIKLYRDIQGTSDEISKKARGD